MGSYLIKIFSLNTKSLAIFRIVLGLSLIIDLSVKLAHSTALYSDIGVLPRADQIELIHPNFWSLFFISGTPLWSSILIFITLLVTLSFTFGQFTRSCAAILWVLIVSMQNRNLMILNGGDDLIRFLLLWSIFLPLDRHYSLRDSQESKNVLNIGTIGLITQLIILYWQTGWLKTGPEWADGSALGLVLHLDVFTTSIGNYLATYPEITKILTYLSLWTEKYLIFFVLLPFFTTRFSVVLAFILLHLGIWLTMNIGVFPLVCIALWLALIPQLKTSNIEIKFSKISTTLGLGIISLTVWWVMATMAVLPPVTDAARGFIYSTRLDQHWSMFAPSPLRNDGFFIFKGLTLERRNVQVGNNFNEYTKPVKLSQTFKAEVWRKYFLNLNLPNNKPHLSLYAEYLCNDFNLNKIKEEDKLGQIEIIFVEELSMNDFKHEKLESKSLKVHNCKETNEDGKGFFN